MNNNQISNNSLSSPISISSIGSPQIKNQGEMSGRSAKVLKEPDSNLQNSISQKKQELLPLKKNNFSIIDLTDLDKTIKLADPKKNLIDMSQYFSSVKPENLYHVTSIGAKPVSTLSDSEKANLDVSNLAALVKDEMGKSRLLISNKQAEKFDSKAFKPLDENGIEIEDYTVHILDDEVFNQLTAAVSNIIQKMVLDPNKVNNIKDIHLSRPSDHHNTDEGSKLNRINQRQTAKKTSASSIILTQKSALTRVLSQTIHTQAEKAKDRFVESQKAQLKENQEIVHDERKKEIRNKNNEKNQVDETNLNRENLLRDRGDPVRTPLNNKPNDYSVNS